MKLSLTVQVRRLFLKTGLRDRQDSTAHAQRTINDEGATRPAPVAQAIHSSRKSWVQERLIFI